MYQWKKLTPDMAAKALKEKYGHKVAWLKAGNNALRAFPSSLVQKYWQRVTNILKETLDN